MYALLNGEGARSLHLYMRPSVCDRAHMYQLNQILDHSTGRQPVVNSIVLASHGVGIFAVIDSPGAQA